MSQIKINYDECSACGICYQTFPDYLKEGEDLKPKIIKQPETDEKAQEIIDSCPNQVISKN